MRCGNDSYSEFRYPFVTARVPFHRSGARLEVHHGSPLLRYLSCTKASMGCSMCRKGHSDRGALQQPAVTPRCEIQVLPVEDLQDPELRRLGAHDPELDLGDRSQSSDLGDTEPALDPAKTLAMVRKQIRRSGRKQEGRKQEKTARRVSFADE